MCPCFVFVLFLLFPFSCFFTPLHKRQGGGVKKRLIDNSYAPLLLLLSLFKLSYAIIVITAHAVPYLYYRHKLRCYLLLTYCYDTGRVLPIPSS